MFLNFLYSAQGMPIAEIKSWGDIIFGSFLNLLNQIMNYSPSVMGAIIVIFFGWPIAVGLGRLAAKVAKVLKVQDFISRISIIEKFEKTGMKINAAHVLGELTKWFVVLVVLTAAVQILSLAPVADFLKYLLYIFIPRLIVAVLIIIVGLILADPVYRGVKGGSEAAVGSDLAEIVGAIAKWAIIILTVLTALEQLNIQLDLIKILFTGVVIMVAIAGGLAFGLGGQYHAREMLDKIKKKGK